VALDAYMSLWYRVIAELAGTHYVMDGWEYSTGGAKEVMMSMIMQWGIIRRFNLDVARKAWDMPDLFSDLSEGDQRVQVLAMRTIRVLDARGDEITLDRALEMVVAAILRLKDAGLPYEDPLSPASSLKKIPLMSPLWMAGPKWRRYEPMTDVFMAARETVNRLIANS